MSKPKVDIIEFQGILFRRYPNSKHWADSRYYTPHIAQRKLGVGRLHEEVWKKHRGSIPEGYHVHHKNGETIGKANNRIGNLECLSPENHAKHHKVKSPKVLKKLKANMAKATVAAVAWHGSEEGRAQHSKQQTEVWKNKLPTDYICQQCFTEFESTSIRKPKFCSNNCKQKFRKYSGIDDEIRKCKFCKKKFSSWKYNKTQTCSMSCGQQLRRVLESR